MRTQQHRRLPLYGTIAAALLMAAGTAAPAVADPTPVPAPIGPHEYFVGVVNGITSTSGVSRIKVVCAGPVGGTGHPAAGQTVAVLPARSTDTGSVGYTGPADRIAVDFGVTWSNQPLVLTGYGTGAEIPTTMNLPCSGTGRVVFNPVPVSDSGMPSVVEVEYVNIAV